MQTMKVRILSTNRFDQSINEQNRNDRSPDFLLTQSSDVFHIELNF